MGKKRVVLTGSLIVSILVFTFCGWSFFKYLRQWALIRMEHDAISQMRSEISQYQKLGFEEKSELIAVLQKRLQQIKMRKRSLKNSWLEPEKSVARHSRIALKQLFDVNRKMLTGYIKDVQEYRKRGVSTSSNIVRFSYDKMVRLTIALSELEHQLNERQLGEQQLGEFQLDDHQLCDTQTGEFTKRLHRMQEITRQSIVQYKDALEKYRNTRVSDNDPKMQFVRMQLTRRIKELALLDSIHA